MLLASSQVVYSFGVHWSLYCECVPPTEKTYILKDRLGHPRHRAQQHRVACNKKTNKPSYTPFRTSINYPGMTDWSSEFAEESRRGGTIYTT